MYRSPSCSVVIMTALLAYTDADLPHHEQVHVHTPHNEEPHEYIPAPGGDLAASGCRQQCRGSHAGVVATVWVPRPLWVSGPEVAGFDKCRKATGFLPRRGRSFGAAARLASCT